ncbi:MAG: response regulator, partial [Verrucomicrobiota bacterium]
STPMIHGDRGQIETLLINLAVHARESMLNGGRFEITTSHLHLRKPFRDHVQLNPGEYAVITIKDSGHGLSEEYQEHLFDPFFVKEAVGHNSGLGLATVYAIVKQHQGQISCSSQMGKGSVFKIYLPVLTQAPNPPAPTQIESPKDGSLILVVEDEEVLRDFASLILQKHGFQVVTARDGAEALALAEKDPTRFNLLFTDVVMPRVNGADLWRKLVKLSPGLPVIFTSGYPRTILSESGLEDNAHEFLQKPYTTKALLAKIREVLGTETAQP